MVAVPGAFPGLKMPLFWAKTLLNVPVPFAQPPKSTMKFPLHTAVVAEHAALHQQVLTAEVERAAGGDLSIAQVVDAEVGDAATVQDHGR